MIFLYIDSLLATIQINVMIQFQHWIYYKKNTMNVLRNLFQWFIT